MPGAYTLPAVDGLESLEPQEPITTARIQPSQFSTPPDFTFGQGLPSAQDSYRRFAQEQAAQGNFNPDIGAGQSGDIFGIPGQVTSNALGDIGAPSYIRQPVAAVANIAPFVAMGPGSALARIGTAVGAGLGGYYGQQAGERLGLPETPLGNPLGIAGGIAGGVAGAKGGGLAPSVARDIAANPTLGRLVTEEAGGVRVYRGGPIREDNFAMRTDPGYYGEGTYFSESPETAAVYARNAKTNVTSHSLSLRNPFVIDYTNLEAASKTATNAAEAGVKLNLPGNGFASNPSEFSQTLKAQGYDGVVIKRPNEPTEYVAFTPSESVNRPSAINQLLTSESGGIRLPFGREPVQPAKTFEQGAPIPEHEPIPPIQKLTLAIQNAGKATPEQRAMFAQQRAQQAGRGAGALERGIAQGQGQGAFQAAKGAMAGEFERPSFQVPAFTAEDAHGLYQTIGTADNVRYFDKVNASEALTDLLGGRIPQPAQLESLQKVFPKEAENLFRAVQQKKGIDWWKEFTGAAGAPQVLQTLGDLSATLRQGMVLGWSHPLNWLKAVGAQVRAVQSEEVGNAIRQGIENDAMFTRSDGLGFKDVGGHIYGGERYAPGTERAGGFAGLNESRVSQAIQKAPILGPVTRASERAFDTLLNAQGFGVYKQVASDMLEHGVTDPLRFEKVAQVVNHARGYGSFAPGKIAEGLNALYSGRNFLSRFEVIIDPIRYRNYPEARNLAAKNLAGFITANMTLLGFLAETGSVSGLWSVNFDPRSADWGKVKIGNARIDPWAGFGPIVRLASRLATGETQNQKGETQPIHPDQEILRFFQNKESPAANIIATKLLGQNEFPGQEKGFDAKTAANLFTPLLIQDVVDAIQKQGGLAPVAVGAGSFFGLGAQTYNPSTSIQRDQAAQEMGLADYESATKEQRKQINDKLGIKTGIANIAQVSNIEAADQALKKFPGAAGDSYVKYKTFYRDLNESEESKQAWQDSKDLIAKYEAVTSPERLEQVAQAKYKKPFSQLTPGQQNAVTGDIHSAYREQRPELDAWLAYWGANDSVKTQEAGRLYEEFLKRYTKTGKGPAVKLSK